VFKDCYFMELFVFQIHDTPIIVLWIVKQRTEVSSILTHRV